MTRVARQHSHRKPLHLWPQPMASDLPYAADAEVSLSYDELEVSTTIRSSSVADSMQVLRIQYQKELAQGYVTVQTKFNYAWGLVKSPMRDHQVEGVRLLQGLLFLRVDPSSVSVRGQSFTEPSQRGAESACTIWLWAITRWETLTRQRSLTVRRA